MTKRKKLVNEISRMLIRQFERSNTSYQEDAHEIVSVFDAYMAELIGENQPIKHKKLNNGVLVEIPKDEMMFLLGRNSLRDELRDSAGITDTRGGIYKKEKWHKIIFYTNNPDEAVENLHKGFTGKIDNLKIIEILDTQGKEDEV